jgi:hypothetical protein
VSKIPRRAIIAQLAGIPLGIAGGLFIYFGAHQAFGLVIAALAGPAALFNLLFAARSQRRLADPSARLDQLTGQIVTPVPAFAAPIGRMPVTRWVGAADVPSGLGRTNVTFPLGLLELTGPALTLRIRPAFLTGMFGMKPLVVSPREVEAVFPARVRLRSAAIGIRPYGQPPSYFLTLDNNRAAILTALGDAGFPIEWSEHKFSYA